MRLPASGTSRQCVWRRVGRTFLPYISHMYFRLMLYRGLRPLGQFLKISFYSFAHATTVTDVAESNTLRRLYCACAQNSAYAPRRATFAGNQASAAIRGQPQASSADPGQSHTRLPAQRPRPQMRRSRPFAFGCEHSRPRNQPDQHSHCLLPSFHPRPSTSRPRERRGALTLLTRSGRPPPGCF